jgi:hypothetical protein
LQYIFLTGASGFTPVSLAANVSFVSSFLSPFLSDIPDAFALPAVLPVELPDAPELVLPVEGLGTIGLTVFMMLTVAFMA